MAPDYRQGCIRHCSICLYRVRLSKDSGRWQVVRRERSSQLRDDVEEEQEWFMHCRFYILHRLIAAQLISELQYRTCSPRSKIVFIV